MGVIGYFLRHPVAANLLMVLMIASGLLALKRLPVQFFPDFSLPLVRVALSWAGASPVDVERSATTPLEEALKGVDGWRRMVSTSLEGRSSILIEFSEKVDPLLALNQVRQKVDEVADRLPEEASRPEVLHLLHYEPVLSLLVTGERLSELRPLVHRFKEELIERGVDHITVMGLPEEEIEVAFRPETLELLGRPLSEVSRWIEEASENLPAGSFGEGESEKVVRIAEKRQTLLDLASLPLVTPEGDLFELAAFAELKRKPLSREPRLRCEGRPAVVLQLERTEGGDTFKIAETFFQWLEETERTLPDTIGLKVFHPAFQYIRDRIALLLKNGAQGLVLVLAILRLRKRTRIAFWVAMGIPASILAALAFLYGVGGSLDMVALFALIMALGIVVDDAIVVGENALARFERGLPPLQAAQEGAERMVAPVLASSLTTIAAFLPLMLVSGPTGKILFAIPLMVSVTIAASLLECFLVLPAHLKGALTAMAQRPPSTLRQPLATFRERHFRQAIAWALRNRPVVLAGAGAFLILALALLAGKRVHFFFFEAPDADMVYATAIFVPGTPPEQVSAYLDRLKTALHEAERALSPKPLVRTVIQVERAALSGVGRIQAQGKHLGGLIVELLPSEEREVSSRRLLQAWRERLPEAIGLDHVLLTERQAGIPGRDVSVVLLGTSPEQLKAAASELKSRLEGMPGLFDVVDDLPYGREEWRLKLTPFGEVVGLTPKGLGELLRGFLSGIVVERFQEGPEEVEVRVALPEPLRRRLDLLDQLELPLPSGGRVPLLSVAEVVRQRGFELLRHLDGHLAVEVSADVDRNVANPQEVMGELFAEVLPELATRYGISYRKGGKAREQEETLNDMVQGAYLGLVLIYLILAWVFGSYGWPLLVMAIIPFGLAGALFGHWLLGLDVTVLSLFGLFGLAGIVVNDAIILISFYRELREEGLAPLAALEEAACRRLRAVVLTSATTVAGLLPLLFETSLQAKFLIPMAVSIVFGLLFSTLWVLILVPVLLSYYEGGRAAIKRWVF